MSYTNVTNLGNHILVRGVENGKRYNHRNPYKPTLYVKENRAKKVSTSKWKTLDGQTLEPLKFDSIYECRDFLKKYREVENFKIYGQTFFQYAYIAEKFPGQTKFDTEDVVVGTVDIEVKSDNGFPEPEQAFSEITAITLHVKNRFHGGDAKNGVYYTFGCGDYVNTRDDVIYHQCADEKDLIEQFLQRWEQHYVDIVTGWNCKKFDIPYIINRMKRIFMEEQIKRLSPWGKVQEREVFERRFGTQKKIQVYEISGMSIVDYMEIYQRLPQPRNHESFSLDHISFVELGERKMDYSEHDNLHMLYLNDYQKFISYNIKDVSLVLRLNDKLKLMELVMTLAYDNKVNFVDVLSQVRMWDAITASHLQGKGIIIPPKKETEKGGQYAGAYVKEPKAGKYKYVVSFDLDGLYPHLIMMYNLGPETLVDPASVSDEFYAWYKSVHFGVEELLDQSIDLSILKKYNLTVTPNGQVFKRDKQGFLAELMESMYEDRKSYKKKAIAAKHLLELAADPDQKAQLVKDVAMYDNFQQAKKVTLNSAYGAIGNEYFRFFDIRIAEAVTKSGQLAIRWVQRDMNLYLNKLLKTTDKDFVIASDTDSMYLNLELLIETSLQGKVRTTQQIIDLMDKICDKHIQVEIQNSFRRLDEYVNSFAPKMSMKREALADIGIWTGKKHYLLNLWDLEGVRYEKPKLKIVGLEAVKAGSLTTAARGKIKKAYEYIVANDRPGLLSFTDAYKIEFRNLSVEDIALPKTCNDLTGYADAETIWAKKKLDGAVPFHVKGSLLYNHLLKRDKLKKYQSIKDGEKIKYVYLREPNAVQSNIIAFPSRLPPEFDLHPQIDYDTQFDKSFINPVTTIMDAIGWKWEETHTLDAFFA